MVNEATRDEVVQSGGRSDESVLDDMNVIGRVLDLLVNSASDADPAGGVERMMHCSWFGELILAFPQADAIRVSFAASDDKTSLAGTLSFSSLPITSAYARKYILSLMHNFQPHVSSVGNVVNV